MACTFEGLVYLTDHGSTDHMICKFNCIVLLDNTVVSYLATAHDNDVYLIFAHAVVVNWQE